MQNDRPCDESRPEATGAVRQPASAPHHSPGHVLTPGNLFMKVTNNGVLGNPFTNLSSDPSGQWPRAPGVEYLNAILLAVAAVNPLALPGAGHHVSSGREWAPASLDPLDRIYTTQAGAVNGARYVNEDGDLQRQFPHAPVPDASADSARCPRTKVRVNGFSMSDNDGDAGLTPGVASFLLLGQPLDGIGENGPTRVGFRAFRAFAAQVLHDGTYAPRPGVPLADYHGRETPERAPSGLVIQLQGCADRDPMPGVVFDNSYSWFDVDCDYCTGVWDAASQHGLTHQPWTSLSPTLAAPPTPPSRATALSVTPNPALGLARLRYSLATPGAVDMALYDMVGRRIRALVSATIEAGEHEVAWDGEDDAGHPAAAGVYLIRFSAAGRTSSVRVVRRR